MAWNATLGISIRAAVGDAKVKYTDLALAPLILVAAQAVTFNVTTTQSYMVNFENVTLTPDPTDPTINDSSFIYLVTLKASAMLLRSEVRVYGQQAIAIRDGSSAIDLKRDLRALSDLATQYETELNKAISLFIRNNTLGIGLAVTSPYPNLLPRIDSYFCDNRSYRGIYG